MRKKGLVSSSYPAPYRVDVFKYLSRSYDLDVYFSSNKNENSNEKWFCQNDELNFIIITNFKKWIHFIKKLINIRKYDFVLIYDCTTKPSLLAVIFCHLFNIPYFINSDGAIYHKSIFRRFVKRIIYPFIFKGATALFSSGKSATDNYLKYGANKMCIYKHNFTSLHSEDILCSVIDSNEKIRIRHNLNLPLYPMVLSIGQFIYRKGFDILLQSWIQISCNATLVIIGGGKDKEMYEKMIEKYHIKNVFIMDFMNKQDLYPYYKASDIFVLPTREDIWGLVINEAMAQGVPVITTDKCMAGVELIDNGINGYVVKAEDDIELAEKINYLLKNENIRMKMSSSNLEKIHDWTTENIAKSHITVIESKLSK